MSAWRKGTQDKYETYLRQWMQYCSQNGLDIFKASVVDGLKFLTNLHEQGKGFSCLKTARAVLSSILTPKNGIEFSREPLVAKFMKGAFNINPSLPKYSYVWDVKQLFDYFRKNPENAVLTLKDLTMKLATILALLFCQRGQTIHSLDTRFMKIEDDAIGFAFPDLLKQSRPGKHLEPQRIKRYLNEPKLCPVEITLEYLKRTKETRNEETKLFLSVGKPIKAVSSKTISRWLKTTLANAGINTTIFQGHSLRTTGSSTAKAQGAPIGVILSAGGWSSEKTFALNYDKPIMDRQTVQEVILNS